MHWERCFPSRHTVSGKLGQDAVPLGSISSCCAVIKHFHHFSREIVTSEAIKQGGLAGAKEYRCS